MELGAQNRQSLSVPQNQSTKHKNRPAKQRASWRETASREASRRLAISSLPLDFCVSLTDSEEQKEKLGITGAMSGTNKKLSFCV